MAINLLLFYCRIQRQQIVHRGEVCYLRFGLRLYAVYSFNARLVRFEGSIPAFPGCFDLR